MSLVRRARIGLLAADGVSSHQIAVRVGVTDKTVRLWRGRIAANPCVASLEDMPRSGRPPSVPLEVRLKLVSLACERADDDKAPFRDVWSHSSLRDAVRRATGWLLSLSEVGRILRSQDIRPHRIRMWLNKQDPRFLEKARRVCEAYLNAPADATVLCVDEKRLFAHERLHPLKPASRSRPVRKEFAYRRNGTSTLLAAFDVRTGEVYGECRPKRKAVDLLEFMETLAGSLPGPVIVVWDNLNIHYDGKDKRWTRFNERHDGRFTFVHTPIHASWLNQVEIWFSTLERRLLKHGSFASVDQLNQRVEDFIVHYNDHEAHPYRWTFRPQQDKTPRAQAKRRALPRRRAHPVAA
jgi:transposase